MSLMGVAFLTPLPLYIALLIKKIRKCITNRRAYTNVNSSNNNEGMDNDDLAKVSIQTNDDINGDDDQAKKPIIYNKTAFQPSTNKFRL